VETEKGEGSRFVLRLPKAEQNEAPPQLLSRAKEPA
jgi:hypothetical protein